MDTDALDPGRWSLATGDDGRLDTYRWQNQSPKTGAPRQHNDHRRPPENAAAKDYLGWDQN